MKGLVFDKYEVVERLAVGGMGEVFYAVQRGSVRGFQRPVILKSLLPDLALQEGFVEQFLDEARVAATLNHPNVVSIHEVGSWQGTYFIAMEFIRGRNLSQLIRASLKKGLPIPPAVTARVVHDAALGLDHAHNARDQAGARLNIVHRDISPQNIMVRDDGVAKVVDFGIARAANRSTRTATGALKGKIAYMAPEQIAGQLVTASADQYALGVVLWELCTRRRLFRADRDIELMRQVLEGAAVPPGAVVPGLPEELDEIVMRMLSKEPARRFPNVAEVARELEAFLVKFSPPSSESPVAAYMSRLGFEELTLQPAPPTPSSQNFLVSLKPQTDDGAQTRGSASAPATKPGRLAVTFAAALAVGAGLAALGVRQWGPNAHDRVSLPPTVAAPAAIPSAPNRPEPALPSRAVLSVATTPAGASLRLNGRRVGETPFSAEVVVGPAHLQLEKAGYLDAERDLELGDDGASIELTLEKQPAGRRAGAAKPEPAGRPAAPEKGILALNTAPWTRVTVDGKPAGLTPFYGELRAGSHLIVVETESGKSQSRTVEIKGGEVVRLQLNLE